MILSSFPTVHLPCSALHFLLLLVSDSTKRHFHFIFRLGRWLSLCMMSPHCSIFPSPTDSSRLLLLACRLHVWLMYEIWEFLRRSCWRSLTLTGVFIFVCLSFRYVWGACCGTEVWGCRYGVHQTSSCMYSPCRQVCCLYQFRYVWLFSSLDVTGWAWGCIVLTILYTVLLVATAFETRQLAGYLSILQIYLKLLFVVEFLFNCYE